ncbi:cell wall metabolism sensor histidine kinase WalK [Lacihabitans sp. LS3-19]|uniref:sensor histidine kinase n=1 Tax=Lacihabitans sp. LS3-19 TaxID=2487335 RepID=UPI0020CBD0F6|nr:HAMP domain-containing sensor histidine kinase [Lacihabitans sp. LS3-19]
MNRINVLIGLMLLALVSLIGFQWYWIQDAITVKKEQFDRKVNETLKETVQQIEKQEVIFLTKQRIIEEEKKRLLEISQKKKQPKREIVKKQDYVSDTLNFVYADGNQLKMQPRQVVTININSGIEPKSDAGTERMFIFPEQESEYIRAYLQEEHKTFEKFRKRSRELAQKQSNLLDMTKVFDEDPFFNLSNGFPEINWVVSEDNSTVEIHGPELPQKPRAVSNSISNKWANNNSKKQEKVNLMKDVMKDFIIGKRSIYERLGHVMLDTLLKKEFAENGINIPFEYSVKDNGNVIFASLNKQESKSNHLNYKIKLFPNDTFQQEQFLQVNFPEKQNYILKNLWSVFGSSFLLIAFVGGIFYYSVNSLLTQKKLSNIKNDFINNMTHELKTPVSTIALALEVIKDKDIHKSPEKTERYLNIITEENQRLGTQIEKVLQIAKLEKGDLNLNFEPIDINEILDQVVKNQSVALEQYGVKLNLDLKAEETIVSADSVHLTNIFFNLMDNAIKYAKEQPEISIATSNSDSEMFISISDKGIGIPKDQLSKIFDKFYRVPKGDLHDVKGYGLGLSYVKTMVELHKGKIVVNSKINEGTEFLVTMPLSTI